MGVDMSKLYSVTDYWKRLIERERTRKKIEKVVQKLCKKLNINETFVRSLLKKELAE
jgi:hypothetical protein